LTDLAGGTTKWEACGEFEGIVILSESELPTVAVATFPAALQSVPAARRFVRSALEDLANGDVVEVAVLLTSEVVTNAVVHTNSAVEVTLRRSAGALQVAVRGQSPSLPVLSPPVGLQEGGRGLLLVNEMADVWGAERTGEGKIVWFQLASTATDRCG
jgi:anti-sigma regulatory factor (Ser/Thr protein kinase)